MIIQVCWGSQSQQQSSVVNRRRTQMGTTDAVTKPMLRPVQSLERDEAVRIARAALSSQESLSIADGLVLARQLLRALAFPE